MQKDFEPLRIGQIGTRIYPDIGGPANYVFHLTLWQNLMGLFNITIASKPLRKLDSRIVKSFHSLPLNAPEPNSRTCVLLLFAISYFILSVIYSCFYFFKEKVDIIHAHSPSISAFAGAFISKILSLCNMACPVVETVKVDEFVLP